MRRLCSRIRLVAALGLVTAALQLSCSDDKDHAVPPGAVGDLHQIAWSETSIEIAWTAVGDVGGTGGAAAAYDLRYSTAPIGDGTWDAANQVAGVPAPGVPGSQEKWVAQHLPDVRPLYFALKVQDAEGNESPLSNVAVVDGYLAPISIANQVHNLGRAYEAGDSTRFGALLAPDYLYMFDPADVAHGRVPESWGPVDEAIAAQRLFSGEPNLEGLRLETIWLDFLAAGDPQVSDADPAWTMITMMTILEVGSVHPERGTMTYLVQGDQAILHFVETDQVDQATGQVVWLLIRWVDNSIGYIGRGGMGTEAISWGVVKALWRWPEGTDAYAPAAIHDLHQIAWSETSLDIAWTAVGDDGGGGDAAAAYDLRYSTEPIDTATWDGAVQVAGEPNPGAPATMDAWQAQGLPDVRPLYLALKAQDAEGNESALSNVAVVDGYLAPISIANQVHNLERAYETRDYERFVPLFDPEFTFVFTPQDVVEHNLPESWGLADERIATERLFSDQPNSDGYRAQQIRLNLLPIGNPEVSEFDPAWRKITETTNLSIDCLHPEKGTLTYLIQNDQAVFHFEEAAEVDPATGKRIWRISYWVDKSISGLPVERMTWGLVKGLWR